MRILRIGQRRFVALEQADVAPRGGGTSEVTPDPPPGWCCISLGGSDAPNAEVRAIRHQNSGDLGHREGGSLMGTTGEKENVHEVVYPTVGE